MHFVSTFQTPLGPFSVAVDDAGAVAATAFGDIEALRGRLPAAHDARRMRDQSGGSTSVWTVAHADDTEVVPPTSALPVGSLGSRRSSLQPVSDDIRTAPARRQILDYFAGNRTTFTVPLAPSGTPFQQRVWKRLREIPCGETASYGELARELGSSARAVGRANATNPICVIVPCHRVIGANGDLTGFAFGEDVKRRLLELEGALAPA